jgi:hypothetical protein
MNSFLKILEHLRKIGETNPELRRALAGFICPNVHEQTLKLCAGCTLESLVANEAALKTAVAEVPPDALIEQYKQMLSAVSFLISQKRSEHFGR